MSRREFQFVEGTSSKFWAIELEGAAHTVHFGRIGTAGQASRKEFANDLEAKASYDKLVAEKVRKGYSEVGSGAGVSTATATPAPRARPAARAQQAPPPEPPEAEDVAATASTATATLEPAGEPTPVSAPSAPPVVERSIELEPEDWFWSSQRLGKPLPRPEPKPFDFEDCLQRLGKVTVATYGWDWNWSKVGLSPSITREEAWFWLTAMTSMGRDLNPAQLAAQVRASGNELGRDLDLPSALKKLYSRAQYNPIEVIIPLMTLVSFEELYTLLDETMGLQDYTVSEARHRLLTGFRRFVLPYLGADELRGMKELVRSKLEPPTLPSGSHSAYPVAWYLAAILGLHDEVAALVRAIPDDHFGGPENWKDHYMRPQVLVLGLGDPRLIEAEWRRLKLKHKSPEYVTGWLACTGYAALDLVRDSLLAVSNKDECAALVAEFGRVKAPEAAAPMLELMVGSKAPKHARHWLDENSGHAIAGLITTAAGRGKLADAALEYLRDQKKKGRAEFIGECLATVPADVADKVRRDVLERSEVVIPPLDDATTPEPIKAAMGDAAKLKMPAWIAPEDLPKVVVGDRILNDAQATALLGALSKSTLATPHPLVAAVRATADRPSRDAYAWALFERWLIEGAPSKERWAMAAVGLIGSDSSALKLTPMVRAWPGESQHQRAVFGLECLRAIGTDVSLMQLNGMSQKLSFKGLKAKATEMMEAIAIDRGLSRAELEDRIVPDCDLDDRGSRVFDFGPRQFRFVLGTEMKPNVRDPEGKLKTDLPKPGTRDDPALANAALDAWKLLKKQVKEVAKVQAERLEQAMVTGRRWTPADFETLLVKHPLMTNLVRLLLWGGYDASGKLVATFRVTEERDYADVNESTCTLDGLARVGVVHPLRLSDADKSAWGEIFGDYEIIPPFPQLGRASHRLEPGEDKETLLARNKGLKIPAITLVGLLDRHGWARGIPEDAGVFHQHSKAFDGASVTAVIEYDGIPVAMMVEWEDQEVEKCYFIPGIHSPRAYPDYKDPIPLGQVDPVVISEVLGTLGALAAKSK